MQHNLADAQFLAHEEMHLFCEKFFFGSKEIFGSFISLVAFSKLSLVPLAIILQPNSN